MEGSDNDALNNTTPSTSTEGGIFSGSDTRIETKNLPEVPEVIPQAPMSSISPALRTTSTVTGDLQLGGATKKKKWPFVLIGVVAVAVIAAAIALVAGVMGSLTPGEKNAYNITDESRALFNRYVNFLLWNDDSADAPDLIDFLDSKYTFLSPGAMYAEKIKLDGSIERARSYFNDLNLKYNDFSRAFFSTDIGTSDATEEYSRSAIPDYFYEATKGSYLNPDQIANLYIQNGEESVRDLLDSTFKSASENEKVQSLLAARKQYLELYLQAIIQAIQDGCVIDGSLDVDCARPRIAAITSEDLRLTAKINGLEAELRQAAIAVLEAIYFAFYPDSSIIEGSSSR